MALWMVMVMGSSLYVVWNEVDGREREREREKRTEEYGLEEE